MVNNAKSIKKKIMIIVTIFSFFLMSLFIYIYYINYQKHLQKEASDFNKALKQSYQYEVELLDKFYSTRIKCNIGDIELLKHFKNEDTKNLYSVVKDKYSALIDENKYLKVMHFSSKDNITILRAHNPKKYDDNLSTFRPIVKNTNQLLKEHFGFEAGKHGLYYRIINPIFTTDKEHIGSLEFGIELDYFVDRLKKYNPLNKYSFMVNKEELKNYNKKDETLELDDKLLLSDDDNFFRHIHKNIDFEKVYIISEHDNKTYLIVKGVNINNYLKEPIGFMISALDISKVNNIFIQQRNHTIVLGSILLFASLIMLNFGFNRYIKQLLQTTEALKDKVSVIKTDNSLLEKYTISSKTDKKGKITHVSDAFCQISGYSRDELMGKNHNIVRHEDMPESLYEELWSLIKVGQYWEGELKNKKKDGTYYWVKAYITPQFDNDENIIGYNAVRQDITLEKDNQNNKK